MFVLAFEVDLHINESRSLKAKRGVIKAILEGAKHRFSVAAAEVDVDAFEHGGDRDRRRIGRGIVGYCRLTDGGGRSGDERMGSVHREHSNEAGRTRER